MRRIDRSNTSFFLALVLATFTSSTALAESPDTVGDHLVWTESTGTDGLTRNVPAVDTRLFTRRIVELQTQLAQQARNLEQEAAEKEFGIRNDMRM